MPPDSIAPNSRAGAPQRAIRTEPHSTCPLCGGTGRLLYQGLCDRLFNVPGLWNLRRCEVSGCEHVWLDPRPIEADIALLYENYYTHGADAETPPPPSKRRTTRNPIKAILKAGNAAFMRLSGLAREREALYGMYLAGRRPGRLLEIGCGSGARLAHFAAQGWTVLGQDVDEKAAARATALTDLPVHLGPIESLPGSAGPFDAVVMNHVIEHVPDPVALLRHAGALMAPGGVLIAVTPNIESLVHRWFNADWRGLEPPRHLHLFSPRTLRTVAQAAGFRRMRVTTSAANAESLIQGSWKIANARRFESATPETPNVKTRLKLTVLQSEALIRHRLNPDSGEECVLIADADAEPHPIVDPLSRDRAMG